MYFCTDRFGICAVEVSVTILVLTRVFQAYWSFSQLTNSPLNTWPMQLHFLLSNLNSTLAIDFLFPDKIRQIHAFFFERETEGNINKAEILEWPLKTRLKAVHCASVLQLSCLCCTCTVLAVVALKKFVFCFKFAENIVVVLFCHKCIICAVFLKMPLPFYTMSCWCCVDSLTTWNGEKRQRNYRRKKSTYSLSKLMSAYCCQWYVKVFSTGSEGGAVSEWGAVAADSETVPSWKLS